MCVCLCRSLQCNEHGRTDRIGTADYIDIERHLVEKFRNVVFVALIKSNGLF